MNRKIQSFHFFVRGAAKHITLGPIFLDVDVAATRRFYETSNDYIDCTCAGCRNFLLAAPQMPPILLDALHQLGVDPLNPAEQWVDCASADGKSALYGGFYHVCGKIVNGADHWLTPDLTLLVHEDCSLLSPDFPAPALRWNFAAISPGYWRCPPQKPIPAHNLYYPLWHPLPTTSSIPRSALQSPAPQAASFPVKAAPGRPNCKYREKTFFHDSLHCHLDFPFPMRIIGIERISLQGFLHNVDQYGREVTVMMWILLAALVSVVVLSVKEQLDRERDVACMNQLAREYSL